MKSTENILNDIPSINCTLPVKITPDESSSSFSFKLIK